MPIQCPQCPKLLKGPAQLRIHSQIHQSSSLTPTQQGHSSVINPNVSLGPIAQSATQSLSGVEQMKQQLAAQNEILMLMSTNKMLREAMQPSKESSVKQPTNTQDFLTQFTAMRDFEKKIEERVLEEIEDDEEDDNGDLEEMFFNGILKPAMNQNGTNKNSISSQQTESPETQVNQALSN